MMKNLKRKRVSFSRQVFKVFICLVFSHLLLFGFSEVFARRYSDFNVLFLTIDSLRPDHLSCYGYYRKTSPNIDKIASEGVVFFNAWANSGWTSPSLVSIFTAMFPTSHGVEVRGRVFSPRLTTPVEVLAEAGWRTYAKHWTGDTIGNLGFHEWNKDIFTFLEEKKDEKWFAWFHLRGPHLPYNPPPKYSKLFVGKLTADVQKIRSILSKPIVFKEKEKLELTEEEKQFVIALYDAEIRAQDEFLGKIIQKLKELELWRKTIIVITSDHGEELFEHGWVGHASTSRQSSLYNEIVRIPLIIRIPGISRINSYITAQQIDILPTLLEILGVQRFYDFFFLIPLFEIKGRKFVFKRKSVPVVFASTSPCGWQCRKEEKWKRIWMLVRGEWKILYTLGGTFELYRLPDEKTNLFSKEKDIAIFMARELFSKVAETQSKSQMLRTWVEWKR